MIDDLLTYLSIFAFFFGVYCVYRIRKRQFDRTNKYGKEEFPSYLRKIKAELGDMALWVIAFVSIGYAVVYTFS